MSVSFEFKQGVDAVYQLLTDPDFLVERNEMLGEKTPECEVEEYEGEETIVRMTRVVKRDLPSVLAKVFNPMQTITMTETWRPDGDGWEGDMEMLVQGQPVTISGTFSLQPKGKGSLYTVSHSCKAKIPLVGGKVEKFIMSQTAGGALDELTIAKDRLK